MHIHFDRRPIASLLKKDLDLFWCFPVKAQFDLFIDQVSRDLEVTTKKLDRAIFTHAPKLDLSKVVDEIRRSRAHKP